MEQTNLIPFNGDKIRRIWHDNQWYFSVVDLIEVLTESPNPRNYWSMLKRKENQLYTICVQLPLPAKDGKNYKTDCTNTEGVLRVIQSVQSPKAEPIKLWLAQTGKERLEEIEDPEIGLERLTELYRIKGYDEEWIDTRLKTIGIRKELTEEWKKRGVKEGQEYAILTAEIARTTFGLTPSEHKKLKGLEKENLRDHMTNLELLFTALGEEFTKTYAIKEDAQGFEENQTAATKGGDLAGEMRRNAEKKGMQVVSRANFLDRLKESDNTAPLPPDSIEK
jgi:DNA-damage-inducible protein D